MRTTKTVIDEEVDGPTGVVVSRAVRVVDITAEITELGLLGKSVAAVEANRSFISSSPTNAQIVAQVKALSRQMNALIRLTVAKELLDDDTVD